MKQVNNYLKTTREEKKIKNGTNLFGFKGARHNSINILYSHDNKNVSK